jgi:hypothetical protein
MRFVDPLTSHRRLEAGTDAGGNYRLEDPGLTGLTLISIDAMKPGYRRLVGTLRSGGDPKSVAVISCRPWRSSSVRVTRYFFMVVS